MTTVNIHAIVTTGQAKDEAGVVFEWTLRTEPGTGSRALHVKRHGGNTLVWPERLPMPDGPAETRLAAFQIAQALAFAVDRRGRRFVAVATNDHSSGSRMWDVIDTATERPSLAHVCSAKEEWATVIAATLEQVNPDPDDVPF